jgi:hypothetical protein
MALENASCFMRAVRCLAASMLRLDDRVRKTLTFAMGGAPQRQCRCKRVRLDRAVMCHSKLTSRDVESTVEDSENIDVPVVLDQVRDAVMLVADDRT